MVALTLGFLVWFGPVVIYADPENDQNELDSIPGWVFQLGAGFGAMYIAVPVDWAERKFVASIRKGNQTRE